MDFSEAGKVLVTLVHLQELEHLHLHLSKGLLDSLMGLELKLSSVAIENWNAKTPKNALGLFVHSLRSLEQLRLTLAPSSKNVLGMVHS